MTICFILIDNNHYQVFAISIFFFLLSFFSLSSPLSVFFFSLSLSLSSHFLSFRVSFNLFTVSLAFTHYVSIYSLFIISISLLYSCPQTSFFLQLLSVLFDLCGSFIDSTLSLNLHFYHFLLSFVLDLSLFVFTSQRKYHLILFFYRSTVAHWYVICFSPGGPRFKSRQGMIFQNKNEKVTFELLRCSYSHIWWLNEAL